MHCVMFPLSTYWITLYIFRKYLKTKTVFGKQNGSTHFKVRGIEGSEVQMGLKYS